MIWPIPFLINMLTALQGFQFLFYVLVTAAGVVPCGDPKWSPRISFIVHIIFYFWSFEIIGDILRNQITIIGLDIFLTNI